MLVQKEYKSGDAQNKHIHICNVFQDSAINVRIQSFQQIKGVNRVAGQFLNFVPFFVHTLKTQKCPPFLPSWTLLTKLIPGSSMQHSRISRIVMAMSRIESKWEGVLISFVQEASCLLQPNPAWLSHSSKVLYRGVFPFPFSILVPTEPERWAEFA